MPTAKQFETAARQEAGGPPWRPIDQTNLEPGTIVKLTRRTRVGLSGNKTITASYIGKIIKTERGADGKKRPGLWIETEPYKVSAADFHDKNPAIRALAHLIANQDDKGWAKLFLADNVGEWGLVSIEIF